MEEEGSHGMDTAPANPCQKDSGKGKQFGLSCSRVGCQHQIQLEKQSSGGKPPQSLHWGHDGHGPAALLTTQPQNPGFINIPAKLVERLPAPAGLFQA